MFWGTRIRKVFNESEKLQLLKDNSKRKTVSHSSTSLIITILVFNTLKKILFHFFHCKAHRYRDLTLVFQVVSK